MKYYVVVGILGAILLANLIYMFTSSNSFWVNSVTIMGWTLFAVQVVYNYVPKFKLVIYTLKYYILNPTLNWGFKLEYILEKKLDTVEFFYECELILSEFSNFKIEQKNNNRAVYSFQGNLVRISYDELLKNLVIELNERDVSYRYSRNFIVKINSKIEKLNQQLKPVKQKYFVNMKFNKNPLKEVLISEITDRKMKFFRAKFDTVDGSVEIYNDTIILYSDTLSGITKLSQKYLHVSK